MSCFRLYIESTGEEIQVEEVPRLTRRAEELNRVGKLKTDGALGFEIPKTDDNYRILTKFINPNVIDQNYDPIKVVARIGSKTLRFNRLYITNYKNGFQAELRRAEDHWIDKSEGLTLNQIEFGDFTFDWPNIRDNWRLDWIYQDGDQGVYFPIVNYGRFIDGDRLNVSDMRPWFHLLGVLQKGFCQIGWKFECQALETEVGRIAKVYILKENYDNRSEQPESGVLVEQTSPIIINGYVNWQNEVYDNFNEYDSGLFTGNGEYTYKLRGRINATIDCDNSNDSVNARISYRKTRVDGSYAYGDLYRGEVFCDGPGLQSVSFPIIETDTTVNILPGETIEIKIDVGADEFQFRGNLSTQLETRYIEGALLPLSEAVRDDSFLDFFKGVVHLLGGIIETDWVQRKVILRPAYSGMWDNEVFDGYYLENGELISIQSEVDSEDIKAPSNEVFKYYKLKFQDADDFVEKEYLGAEEIFSKKIENLNSKGNETIEDENPYFAPTMNGEYSGLIPVDLDVSGIVNAPVFIPHLWDNDSYENSRDIDPRICLSVYGFLNKELEDGTQIRPDILLNQLGPGGLSIVNQYPVTWQKLVKHNALDDNGKTWKEQGLFYGDKDYGDQTLFYLFYQKKIINEIRNASVEVLSKISTAEFTSLNPRAKYSVEALGRVIVGYLKEIRDYDGCRDITTPLLIAPIRSLSQNCLEDEGVPPSDNCDNVISLEVTYNDPCYDFSVDASGVNSPIDQVILEYRYFDQTTWTAASQLCNPDRAFYVRAQVLMDDDCPDLYDIRFLDPCGNLPELIFNYNPDTGCLSIAIGGTISSVIDNLNSTLEYQINGGTWQNYTTEICGETGEICARATVVYEDGCPSQDIEDCFTIPDEVTECDLTTASVECVDETGNFVSFNLTGTVANESQVLDDWILYREAGTDLWLRWNGELVPCPAEVKRRIIWCDNICPPYCSETIICECDGCTQFNAGTPVNLALCN
jgi:hypothetical protein